MHRNVTAIYRSYATADLVRRELREMGISASDIYVVPDRDHPVDADGRRSGERYSDQLHDLHLPEDDLRTYQESVRRGDYVVSAEVDEAEVSRVQQIMRRPEAEAHNLDQRSAEFMDADLDPYSDPSGRRTDSDWLAQLDPTTTDPLTRAYMRNRRLRNGL